MEKKVKKSSGCGTQSSTSLDCWLSMPACSIRWALWRIPAMASSQGDVRPSPMAYPAVRSLPKLPLPLRPEAEYLIVGLLVRRVGHQAQSLAIALRSPGILSGPPTLHDIHDIHLPSRYMRDRRPALPTATELGVPAPIRSYILIYPTTHCYISPLDVTPDETPSLLPGTRNSPSEGFSHREGVERSTQSGAESPSW